jgi:hypothetical protein
MKMVRWNRMEMYMAGLKYLASPYSVRGDFSDHQKIVIRDRRYRDVCKLAARLMKEGHLIFCPIAHSHPIETIGMYGEIKDGDFWLRQDYAVLKACSELVVYKMPGWEQSYGVAEEIKFAKENNIPVSYIDHIKFPGNTRGTGIANQKLRDKLKLRDKEKKETKPTEFLPA